MPYNQPKHPNQSLLPLAIVAIICLIGMIVIGQ
jgi:hypothetical protein